jgi:hypothetical protein
MISVRVDEPARAGRADLATATRRWVWVAFGKTYEGGETLDNRLPFAVIYEATTLAVSALG